ncbi:MAG: tetratricopeptide repeat protein [Alistipes sp.]
MANNNATEQESLGSVMNKTELFFENNGKKLTYVLLGLIVVAALIFGYRSFIAAPRVTKAADLIAEAQYRFEAATPDYKLALEGDENGAGFLDVVDQYGSTPSGNLAKHYAGICYLKMGDLDNAATYLAKYAAVKGIVGAIINAQNLGLQGDIAVDKADYAKAVKLFVQASEAAENDLTAPMYLQKAGMAEQAQGNTAQAVEFYQRILDDYPSSAAAREAEKLLGITK